MPFATAAAVACAPLTAGTRRLAAGNLPRFGRVSGKVNRVQLLHLAQHDCSTGTSRWFVSGSCLQRHHQCPFFTLGIPSSSSYAEVKAQFIKLALKLHPDVVDEQREEEAELRSTGTRSSADAFIAAREAFEAIVESHDDGMAILREDAANAAEAAPGWGEAEFEAWFHEETGHTVPYDYGHMSTRHMDPAVLREVAEVTDGMSEGGLDKGGMWAYARELREKTRNGSMPSLRVSDGGSSTDANNGKRRRRRQRR